MGASLLWLLTSACGGAAWGQQDGFAEQLSDGCHTDAECEQLIGAAKWRARQCGAVNRKAELCDEAQAHLQTAQSIVSTHRARSLAEQNADLSAERTKNESATAQATAACGSQQQQLQSQLNTRTTEVSELKTEVMILRRQLDSAQQLADALKGDALAK